LAFCQFEKVEKKTGKKSTGFLKIGVADFDMDALRVEIESFLPKSADSLEEILKALQQVAKDVDNWCILAVISPNEAIILCQGSGGLEDFINHMEDDKLSAGFCNVSFLNFLTFQRQEPEMDQKSSNLSL
jgi:hypothetical protein